MTHTDSAAREAILLLANYVDSVAQDRVRFASGNPRLGVFTPLLKIQELLSPPQPEAKPEGLKWKGGITPSPVKGGFGLCYFPNFMGRKWWCVDLRWRSIHEMVRDGHHLAAWPTEEAATSALNACTQPPPDYVEPAKPEAGEIQVADPSELATDAAIAAMSKAIPKPAEPKVMPQPSEQAKGAEKQPVCEQIAEPNAADPVLCYVDGPWAFFTTRKLSEQCGDDWNDTPYEHNAGNPYQAYKSASGMRDGKMTDLTQWKDGRPLYRIVRVAFLADLETPASFANTSNSQWCVDQINAGETPWLRRPKWSSGDKPCNIMAGTTLSTFIKMIKEVGGTVYRDHSQSEFIESERAQHKAEMEAVKKELSERAESVVSQQRTIVKLTEAIAEQGASR